MFIYSDLCIYHVHFTVYVFMLKPPTGRLRAVGSQLQIENVVTSDGGVYICKATNEAGSNTRNSILISKS